MEYEVQIVEMWEPFPLRCLYPTCKRTVGNLAFLGLCWTLLVNSKYCESFLESKQMAVSLRDTVSLWKPFPFTESHELPSSPCRF